MRRLIALAPAAAAMVMAFAVTAVAQTSKDVFAQDALTCWWRSSTPAVRVGEPFTLVLTCTVVDTDAVKVVADESRLDPKAIQLPPFDVLDGSRGGGTADGPKRFFQYRYTLRLIADDRFGKDVKLPSLSVSYRTRTRTKEGALSEGRDQSYELPSIAIRILSTVPEGAADIRDGGVAPFEDVDSRMFRGAVLRAVGGMSLAVAAVGLLMTLAAAVRRGRGTTRAADRRIPAWLVYRGAAAELARIGDERRISGWTQELLDRAVAATRVVAAQALNIPITVVPARDRNTSARGTIVVPASVVRRRFALASSSVTTQAVADAQAAMDKTGEIVHAQRLGDLAGALAVLTTARYGRDQVRDESALDGALATASSQVPSGWPDVLAWLRPRRWTDAPLSVNTRLGSD